MSDSQVEIFHPIRVGANRMAGYGAWIAGAAVFAASFFQVVFFVSTAAMVRLWLREHFSFALVTSFVSALLFALLFYWMEQGGVQELLLLMSWLWFMPSLVALALRASSSWVYPAIGLAVAELALAWFFRHSAAIVELFNDAAWAPVIAADAEHSELMTSWLALSLQSVRAYGLMGYWVWILLALVLGRDAQRTPDWRAARIPFLACIALTGIVLVIGLWHPPLLAWMTLYRMAVLLLLAQTLALLVPVFEKYEVHACWAVVLLGLCLSVHPLAPCLAFAVGVFGIFSYGAVFKASV